MSIHRRVTKAPEGKAGFVIEGLPNHTYDENTAKRLQYMRMDGSDELDLPEDGELGDVPNTGGRKRHAFAESPSGKPDGE